MPRCFISPGLKEQHLMESVRFRTPWAQITRDDGSCQKKSKDWKRSTSDELTRKHAELPLCLHRRGRNAQGGNKNLGHNGAAGCWCVCWTGGLTRKFELAPNTRVHSHITSKKGTERCRRRQDCEVVLMISEHSFKLGVICTFMCFEKSFY